jgi:glycerophosphoryl diester phosphodiesterase
LARVRHKDIIDNAHACGLQVHTWTIGQKEYCDLFDLDVDGVLIDFAHTGVKACDAWSEALNLQV